MLSTVYDDVSYVYNKRLQLYIFRMLYKVCILEAHSLQPIKYSIHYTVSLYNIEQGRVYLRFNISTKLELPSTYTVHSGFYIGWIVLAAPITGLGVIQGFNIMTVAVRQCWRTRLIIMKSALVVTFVLFNTVPCMIDTFICASACLQQDYSLRDIFYPNLL